MTAKDGRKIKEGTSRKNRRAYTKCHKHKECRSRMDSVWRKI